MVPRLVQQNEKKQTAVAASIHARRIRGERIERRSTFRMDVDELFESMESGAAAGADDEAGKGDEKE